VSRSSDIIKTSPKFLCEKVVCLYVVDGWLLTLSLIRFTSAPCSINSLATATFP